MTTYSLIGDNFVTIPRFDVMFSFSNNKKVMLHDYYMRYFAFFCFFGGLNMFWKILRNSPYWFRRLYANIFQKKLKSERHVLIIGYGDIKSISTTIVDTFIKYGYKVVCLYNCYDNETQSKATNPEENIKRNVEIYKEEEFFSEKTSKKMDFEFILDISYEALPYISESKSIISLDKANLKLINYQKIFEFCLQKKLFTNTKIYQFSVQNKLYSPTERHILDTKEVYLKNLAALYENSISIKKVFISNVNNFNENSLQFLYKYSDISTMDSFEL